MLITKDKNRWLFIYVIDTCVYIVYTFNMTTKVQKWGNSYAVRIPKNFIEDLKLRDGFEVELTIHNKSLVIKEKNQKTYSLKELLKGITPEDRNEIMFDDVEVGKEKIVW